VDDIADQAFDDQCTGANPRYPLIKDLKQLILDAYYGRSPVGVQQNGKGEVQASEVVNVG
jgi:acetaldehyde dehydrogenase/alcohol dehydrogenase